MTGAMTTAIYPQRRDFSAVQLKMLRRSICRNCTDPEFDEFIAVASSSGLDPLRRQIVPLISNAADPDRRRVICWTTIDGLRLIAARNGDYRPMESAPRYQFSDKRRDPNLNPLGLERAEVHAWKCSDGRWYSVAGEAWWDEVAPLRDEAGIIGADPSALRGEKSLEPSWARMGRVMLAKCAEAQALRRGWPDLLSALYTQEEVGALKQGELTASEKISLRDNAVAQARLRSAEQYWLVFNSERGLQMTPADEVEAVLFRFYGEVLSLAELERFADLNRASLQLYWERFPASAFKLKRAAEGAMERLKCFEAERAGKMRPTSRAATLEVASEGSL